MKTIVPRSYVVGGEKTKEVPRRVMRLKEDILELCDTEVYLVRNNGLGGGMGRNKNRRN